MNKMTIRAECMCGCKMEIVKESDTNIYESESLVIAAFASDHQGCRGIVPANIEERTEAAT